MSNVFKLAGPDIVHEMFDGDVVALNLASGQYFGFNGSGAEIWQRIVAGQALDQIGATQTDTDKIMRFAERLRDLNLIVPSDAGPAAAEQMVIGDAPTIEVYDDLSDLIIADPIHDVDATAGWPMRPENTGA